MSYNHISICLTCNIKKNPHKMGLCTSSCKVLTLNYICTSNFIFTHPTTYKGCMQCRSLIKCPILKGFNYIGFLVWMINKEMKKLKVFQSFSNAIFYSKWQADAEILSVLLLAASHFNYIIPIAIILCSIVVHICSHHAKGQHT